MKDQWTDIIDFSNCFLLRNLLFFFLEKKYSNENAGSLIIILKLIFVLTNDNAP